MFCSIYDYILNYFQYTQVTSYRQSIKVLIISSEKVNLISIIFNLFEDKKNLNWIYLYNRAKILI